MRSERAVFSCESPVATGLPPVLMLIRKAEAFLKINPIFLLFLGSRVEYCACASELTEDAGWFAPATRRGGSISPYPNELQKYGIDAAVVNDCLAARSRVQHLCVLYTDCVGESASAGFEHFLTDSTSCIS